MRALRSVLLLWALAACLAAEERILDFHSLVEVQADGQLLVTETIKVQAEGKQIRRGIYRELPTRYPRPKSEIPLSLHRVPFKFLGAERDGRKEAWHSQSLSNGLRVYLGKKDVYLDSGIYTYTLRYRYDRVLKHFDGNDELFWNVTGNGWTFPIEKASALIRLPRALEGDENPSLRAYTGVAGSREEDALYAWGGMEDTAVPVDGADSLAYETTRALKKHEGLSIVASWPKGVVSEPSPLRRLRWQLNDHRELVLIALTLLLTLAWSLWSWLKHGVDPPARPLVPRFHPPRDLSPAALRYLYGYEPDATAFTATLVQMAVQGRLRIDEPAKGKGWILKRQAPALRDPLEQAADTLFRRHEAVNTKAKDDVDEFRDAYSRHSAVLGSAFKRDIELNLGRLLPAHGLILLCVLLVGLGAREPGAGVVGGGFLYLLTVIAAFCLTEAFDALQLGRPGLRRPALVGSLVGLVFIGLFAAALSVGLGANGMAPQALGALVLGLPMGFFSSILPRPSEAYMRLREEIEGFILYLSTAEIRRISSLNPPQDTPQLFEKYLPYALAFGLGKVWGKRFARILALEHRKGNYDPAWIGTRDFHRHGFSADAFSGLGGSLSSGLGSSVASASAPPSSSGSGFSGGGGGGGSGGGGGGGGGGGW